MPFQALPGLSGRFPCSPLGLSPCLPTYTTGVKTQKTPSWLHSAARPASRFLQVAPFEAASARASSPFPDSPVRGSPDRALTTCGDLLVRWGFISRYRVDGVATLPLTPFGAL